jgi:D-xylose transport system permease protein
MSTSGIPSFVVTLAAFLAFQGVVLLLLKGGTNISVVRWSRSSTTAWACWATAPG